MRINIRAYLGGNLYHNETINVGGERGDPHAFEGVTTLIGRILAHNVGITQIVIEEERS